LQKRQPNPLRVLNQYTFVGREESTSSFIKFAQRLLSVSANSASCERLFSVLGNILTKLRNRTGNSTLTDLGEAKLHICDEHIAAGTKSRLKRQFAAKKTRSGELESQASATAMTTGATQHLNVDAIIDSAYFTMTIHVCSHLEFQQLLANQYSLPKPPKQCNQ